MSAAAVALPAKCRKRLYIHAFAARTTGLAGRSSVGLMFTASEKKLYMLIVFFIPSFPRKRESTSVMKVSGLPLSPCFREDDGK